MDNPIGRAAATALVLTLAMPSVALAAFLNARGDATFEFDAARVCRDGAGDLTLYDVTEDDPDREVRFPAINAATPPPGDPDDVENNPAPPEHTIIARADVTLEYVPGGVAVDEDNDGQPDEALRYYRQSFELRWERDGVPRELAPGTVVQIDIDEGVTTGPSAVDVEVQDCWLDTLRLWGATRWATSSVISSATYPEDGSASAVVLARGDTPNGFADALSGAPLAASLDAPMLLTAPTALLETAEQELLRVLPRGRTVYLLGGPAALAPEVEARVAELGYRTERIAGADRVQTSLAVAARLEPPAAVLLTSGGAFPDALAAGAAAIELGGVVVLVPPEQRSEQVDAYLAGHPDAARYAVGGPAARPYPEAVPVVGADRIETALEVAALFFPEPTFVGLARADAFPDSLSGGTHIGRLAGPLLLTPPEVLDPRVATHICAATEHVRVAVLYGGSAALSEDVREQTAGAVSGRSC